MPIGLRERIAHELRLGRSLEAIWADMRAESTPAVPFVEMLYQVVYTGARNQFSLISFIESVTPNKVVITMPEGYDADAILAGLTGGLSLWFCSPDSPWQRGQIEQPEPGLALVVRPRYSP